MKSRGTHVQESRDPAVPSAQHALSDRLVANPVRPCYFNCETHHAKHITTLHNSEAHAMLNLSPENQRLHAAHA